MKRILLLAVVVAGTLAVGGCTASQESAEATPAKNLEQWVLPLDQFASSTSGLRDYVENLMVADCLGKQGIDWPVPWRPLDASQVSPSYTAGGARLFTETIATRYGYHLIPVVYQGREEQREASTQIAALVQRDPSVDDKSTACLDKARITIPLPSMENYNYATLSAAAVFDASLQDDAVLTATQAWQTCIDRAGFGGLADSPVDMPGEAKFMEWDLGAPSDVVPISAEEIRMATADATCRLSSGWSEALYDASYSRQVALVKENADKLNRIRDELKQDQERLLDTAAKYAPK